MPMDFFNIEISWKGIGYIVITSVSSVIVLFILTRIMGKRQISQLTMFDYINGITIGSIAAEMATALDGDVWQPLFAMIIYAFFAIMISYISMKSIKARRFLVGRPFLLYENGKLFEKNLKKAKLDINEFLTECRTNGYFYLSDIQSAIFETNGKIYTRFYQTACYTAGPEYQCCKRSPCCQCDYGRAYYAGKSQTYR